MRKDAREVVYKTLFSKLFNDDESDVFSELIEEKKLNENDKQFAKKLFGEIQVHKNEFDEAISSIAKNYKLERIYPTDRCALYIGFCEMKYFDDVPNIVAIDEAISLCRIYSTSSSLAFVNGIFAKYKTMIENNKED